ncbi:MAG: tRNA dihydrouridine synthase DusB [Proteobacteria bacterium]|nr:tRNA dihydrouridine synthase DusB [Pseudomonadota bacterium]
MKIGTHVLRNSLFAAPMAGISDRPFRMLARRFGAGLAVSEMVSSRPELRGSRKSRLRLDHEGEPGPISVQIAGADPQWLADAARYNVGLGAQIIDINMGCPAKKVCHTAAGSALLENEPLVARILEAVVAAVAVPVTLKIRTGPNPLRRNAVQIARIAESAGVQLLTIHGRTRACAFGGMAEYDTIAEVKARVGIPVIANGDIRTPEDARAVLTRTGADGVMIGRAAQGRPWIFREIEPFLADGRQVPPPTRAEICAVLLEHLDGLYGLYGEEHGARIARKHIGWTVRDLAGGEALRVRANAIFDAPKQRAVVAEWFSQAGNADAANDGGTDAALPRGTERRAA